MPCFSAEPALSIPPFPYPLMLSCGLSVHEGICKYPLFLSQMRQPCTIPLAALPFRLPFPLLLLLPFCFHNPAFFWFVGCASVQPGRLLLRIITMADIGAAVSVMPVHLTASDTSSTVSPGRANLPSKPEPGSDRPTPVPRGPLRGPGAASEGSRRVPPLLQAV